MKLKMDVVAPMPRLSVNTTTRLKPGERKNWRSAWRKSPKTPNKGLLLGAVFGPGVRNAITPRIESSERPGPPEIQVAPGWSGRILHAAFLTFANWACADMTRAVSRP